MQIETQHPALLATIEGSPPESGTSGASRRRSHSNLLLSTIRSGICSMDFEHFGDASRIKPKLEGVRLGGVDILRYVGNGPLRGVRQAEHIRRDESAYYVLGLPQSAHFGIRHSGVDSELKPGQFAFVSTDRPFEATVQSASPDGPCSDVFSAIHVRIPSPLLRQRVPLIDDWCNRPIHLGPGTGGIMKTVIEAALLDGPFLSEAQAQDFCVTLVEVIGGAVRCNADMFPTRPGMNRASAREQIRRRAKAFIEANLCSPHLDSTVVAQHCRVSPRYLRLAFAASSQTVATYVRELRLLRCREALRTQTLSERPIIEIAGLWGFENPAHFSRLYRARFGKSPRQERTSQET